MNSKGQISVAEAGRLGGNTTRDRYGSKFYRRIGRKGGESTKKRYSQLFVKIGRRGGRPSRPALSEGPDEGHSSKKGGSGRFECPSSLERK